MEKGRIGRGMAWGLLLRKGKGREGKEIGRKKGEERKGRDLQDQCQTVSYAPVYPQKLKGWSHSATVQ